jgi:hypothetical protein
MAGAHERQGGEGLRVDEAAGVRAGRSGSTSESVRVHIRRGRVDGDVVVDGDGDGDVTDTAS